MRDLCSEKPHGEEWVTDIAVGGDARIHNLEITDLYDLQLTLLKNEQEIHRMVLKDLKDLRRVKWYLSAFIRCQMPAEEDPGNAVRYMRCTPLLTLREDELSGQVGEAILGVINSFDKAQGEGSQILFEKVERIEIRVAKYSPLKGSSYLPLPENFKNPKKGLINIQNRDNKCFLYSCLAALKLPKSHPERVQNYTHRLGELKMSGISFPVKVTDITKFEGQNLGISVNVFGLEDGVDVVPLRISKNHKERHINLLLLRDDEEEEDNAHYVLIKDLSKFLAHLTTRKRALHWCENCLTPYNTHTKYKEHRQRCIEHSAQAVLMPRARDAVMQFRQWGNQMHHDYVIYADFECIVVPYNAPHPDPAVSSTTRSSRHVPCGFCYVIVRADGTLLKEPVLHHGGDGLIRQFLLCLQREQERITELRGELFAIDMSEEQEKEFEKATKCYMCEERLPRSGVLKVRDHDWSKPENNYRGAACSAPCNLNLKRKTYIPVLMHNLQNYDAHMVLSEIGELTDGEDLTVIPKNKEKYVSFQWGRLRFLDSLAFLNSSLDKLVADLAPEDLSLLQTIFPNDTERALVSRKGVYPYSYFDSMDKFSETCLPPMEAFKNDLTGADISTEDYDHAVNVFQTFKMENLRDYHDLYLLTDTLLLADCMEAFRKLAMNHYKLDPVHYYTTPGMAFSASLSFTKQKLELITDLEIHLLFERGLRGGVATIQRRYVEANNKYIPDNYCPDKPSSYIMYYDANSLYSAALCEKLPTGGFRRLTKTEIDKFDPEAINESSDVGYLFVVDLAYPSELHDSQNDFCLAPEHMTPKSSLLSKLQKKMLNDFKVSKSSTKKLIPNLYDKKNYVVLADTLMLYLDLGLELKKIHSVIEFERKAWLKPFIEHNISMRQKATSDFQKSFWKLICNSIYGKCCEAVRKHKCVVMTKKQEKFRKLVRSPLFHSFDIFNHGLVCVERKKARVVLNRPVFVGQACLDISKSIMYNFYYKVLKSKYGDRIKVCGTDTDSLIVEIFTEDVYKDMLEMEEYFDTSDYPKDHFCFNLKNKKVMGKFKDELNSEPIRAFIGLRAKMYSFKTLSDSVKSVGKGIPRAALKSQINFEDYKECITQFKEKNVSYSKIGTDRKHHVFTTYCVKKALSCYDDKRYILDNNFDTLAYGHYTLRNYCDSSEAAVVDDDDDNDDESDDDESDDEAEKNLLDLIELMDEE
ncbi:putative DNA polymerase [Frankliniella fusca]|uniref:DNA-directed DNA polymerase n=1 Tax=Frankliniella fusca TaxID=407009 RepID=A0AAE1HIV7_9NEOP|nr:putative DNA polymerase [Frankliniella fusca]